VQVRLLPGGCAGTPLANTGPAPWPLSGL